MNRRIVYKNWEDNAIRYVKWVILGLVTGVVVGVFAAIFAKCLEYATLFREAYTYTFLTLPIGGLLIVGLYKIANMEHDKGTDNVIEALQEDIVIPFRLSFLIFVSTVITMFCGGSVGREGAALQIGSSLGNTVSRVLRFKPENRRVLIMSGMAAAFSALFHTPMAAAFFAMEVSSIGVLRYAALVPCILASITAYEISGYFGLEGEHFATAAELPINIQMSSKILLLAIGCALLSMFFCVMLQTAEKVMHKYVHNKYVRVLIGSAILIILNLIIGTSDYQGTGMQVIERAIEGDAEVWAFLWKLIFTVVTIAAGFKGGEIVPSFFIGATFGCVVAGILGIPLTLGASIGMVCVFCGVTNCPIATLLISIELFGTSNVLYFLMAIATSYALSGYVSLYHTQVILFAKNEEKMIERKVGHIWKDK